MRNRTLVRVVAVVLLVALVLSMGVAALAQEGESPVGEIIPKPDSGAEPEEAGDRGGSLQVILLGLIGVAITGMVVYVARQSRSARAMRLERAQRAAEERAAAERQPTRASQASTPARNPDR